MSNRGTTSRSRIPDKLSSADRAVLGADPPVKLASSTLEHVGRIRALLFEAEKSCQHLSSAVSAADLPAGSWIYVDALRMGVLAAMRNAQLLELKVRELVPAPAPPAEE